MELMIDAVIVVVFITTNQRSYRPRSGKIANSAQKLGQIARMEFWVQIAYDDASTKYSCFGDSL